jgi:hypothetical protein
MSYDPEADAAENAAQMVESSASVITGELTQAVRASSSDVGPITTGDWIGLVRGEGIVAVGAAMDRTATTLLDAIVGDDAELVTVITGSDADPATTSVVAAWLRDNRGDVATEIQYGGQPLYPYLFGVE